MSLISVMVADRHQLVAGAISCLLSSAPDVKVLPPITRRDELLKMLRQHQPDILLLDADLALLNGAWLLEQIRRECPHVRTLVISGLPERETVQQLMQAGAAGHLLKNVDEAELFKAIRTLRQGGIYFCPFTIELLVSRGEVRVNGAPHPAGVDNPVLLSPREQEVLKLISQGYTNTQIANTLFISPRTAGTHRTNLLKKTGTKNTAELVRYALESLPRR